MSRERPLVRGLLCCLSFCVATPSMASGAKNLVIKRLPTGLLIQDQGHRLLIEGTKVTRLSWDRKEHDAPSEAPTIVHPVKGQWFLIKDGGRTYFVDLPGGKVYRVEPGAKPGTFVRVSPSLAEFNERVLHIEKPASKPREAEHPLSHLAGSAVLLANAKIDAINRNLGSEKLNAAEEAEVRSILGYEELWRQTRWSRGTELSTAIEEIDRRFELARGTILARRALQSIKQMAPQAYEHAVEIFAASHAGMKVAAKPGTVGLIRNIVNGSPPLRMRIDGIETGYPVVTFSFAAPRNKAKEVWLYASQLEVAKRLR